MKNHPPKWSDQLLAWFCNPDLLEDLQGDLHEIFYQKLETSNQFKANLYYVWLVFRSFRWSVIQRNKSVNNSIFTMTKHNFKIALRVLWRDKVNSSLNLIGLTIGISCFLLLGLYVKQEFSYDHFHSKKDRIYRSWLKEDYGQGQVFFNSITPILFEDLFEQNFPAIETAVQYNIGTNFAGRGENKIAEEVAIVSPEFFEVFDFKIIESSSKSIFRDKNSLAISSSYAKKYFNGENPIGQTISIQYQDELKDFVVSAVFQDVPKNSSNQFDLAISNAINDELFSERSRNDWTQISQETYILLKENADISSVTEKMQDVVMSLSDGRFKRDVYQIGFQPLTDIHLNRDIPPGSAKVGNPQYVTILGIISLLVLVIASINYTTLTAGISLKRTKEVGMRKVLGANRPALIYQYLSESIILTFLAMLLGTVITILIIPTFNAITGIEINYIFEWWHAGIYLLMGFAIGLAAGSYPTIVISGFKLITILRGSDQSTGKHAVRKGLIVFQFLVTIFLISTTLIMHKQIQFLYKKDLGYDYDTVIAVKLHESPTSNSIAELISSGISNGELLKTRLAQHPQISKIGMATHVFGSDGWAEFGFIDRNGQFKQFKTLVVDDEYLNAFEIKIKEGRSFELGNGLDSRQSVILNEAAVAYFGIKNPIGNRLPGNDFGDHQIIGVAENFNFTSLHSKIEPLVIVQNITPITAGISDQLFGDSIIPKLVFTYTGTNLLEATEILKKEWDATFPNINWNYEFLDNKIKSQYESEAKTNQLLNVATLISLIIASLGLLGLTLLVINSKEKEIGIRKVMGASPFSIFKLLAKGFSIQMIMAIVFSVPITIFLMNHWLQNFAYSISISADIFILSSSFTIVTALIVISYHAIRASKINPIISLRKE